MLFDSRTSSDHETLESLLERICKYVLSLGSQ